MSIRYPISEVYSEFKQVQEYWIKEKMPQLTYLTRGRDPWDLYLNHKHGDCAEHYPIYEYHRHVCGGYIMYQNVNDECDWVLVRLNLAESESERVMMRFWIDDECDKDKNKFFCNERSLGAWTDFFKKTLTRQYRIFLNHYRYRQNKQKKA